MSWNDKLGAPDEVWPEWWWCDGMYVSEDRRWKPYRGWWTRAGRYVVLVAYTDAVAIGAVAIAWAIYPDHSRHGWNYQQLAETGLDQVKTQLPSILMEEIL